MTRPSLVVWMIVAIGAVAALAWWDAERESTAALHDFASEQAVLAKSAAAAIAIRLTATATSAMAVARELDAAHLTSNVRSGTTLPVALRPRAELSPDDHDDTGSFALSLPFDEHRRVDVRLRPRDLLGGIADIDQPGAVRVLVARPTHPDFVTPTGAVVNARALGRGLDEGLPWMFLTRPEAAELGLPARTAVAGLHAIDAGPFGRWGVAVVASARQQRDRERRAQARLVLSLVLASGLVLAFGGLALRNQRHELELARELAVTSIRNERDDRLVRADKLATMGALATGIAHEVSTPLGVIVGRAEQLVAKVEGDERATRAVNAILAESARIDRIVRGFLMLARGDAPPRENTRPDDLARAAIDLVRHRFERAGVALRSDLRETPRIACEPRLFEQVLVNLLLNACDACGPGGDVTLAVRAEAGKVTFVVTDDGAGIRPEDVARVTEPFFTTKPPGKGTGLGLAIATEIVKHHGGELSVGAREAGDGARGTRATVTVPAVSEGAEGGA